MEQTEEIFTLFERNWRLAYTSTFPLGEGWQLYCVCPPRMGFFTHPTVQFLAPRAEGHDVAEVITSPPNWVEPGPTLFLILPERQAELDLIKQAYPGGITSEEYYRTNDLFFTFYQVNVP